MKGNKISEVFTYNKRTYVLFDDGTGISADGFKEHSSAEMNTVIDKAIKKAENEEELHSKQAETYQSQVDKLKVHKK